MAYGDSFQDRVQKSNSFLTRVFLWMFAGLISTAGAAYGVYKSEFIKTILFSNPWVVFGLLFLQLGAVIVLSFYSTRLRYGTMLALFFFYALLTGVVFSSILVTYNFASVATAFVVSASMFACMALYGYYTQRDLTSLGSFLYMALIGLIIALIVNFFVVSSWFEYALSIIGVIIFVGLTAYDVQRLRVISEQADSLELGDNDNRKRALLGALTLYLDFINLFLMVLRLLGRRR